MSDPVDFVKGEIFGCFAEGNAKVGHVLDLRALLRNCVIYWTPEQKDAFQTALSELALAGKLERRNGQYFLTQKGADQLSPPLTP